MSIRDLHQRAPHVGGPSWRGHTLVHWWDIGDAVIGNDARAPRPNYEVYTYGELVAARSTLAEAKRYVEDVYGPLDWRIERLPPAKVDHYFFGPTTEFTDPTQVYVVDHLPKLGARRGGDGGRAGE
jgi:hypothetical protein